MKHFSFNKLFQVYDEEINIYMYARYKTVFGRVQIGKGKQYLHNFQYPIAPYKQKAIHFGKDLFHHFIVVFIISAIN